MPHLTQDTNHPLIQALNPLALSWSFAFPVFFEGELAQSLLGARPQQLHSLQSVAARSDGDHHRSHGCHRAIGVPLPLLFHLPFNFLRLCLLFPWPNRLPLRPQARRRPIHPHSRPAGPRWRHRFHPRRAPLDVRGNWENGTCEYSSVNNSGSFVFRVSEFRGRVLVVLRVRVSVESSRNGEDVRLMPMRVLSWSWKMKLLILSRSFCAWEFNLKFPTMRVLLLNSYSLAQEMWFCVESPGNVEESRLMPMQVLSWWIWRMKLLILSCIISIFLLYMFLCWISMCKRSDFGFRFVQCGGTEVNTNVNLDLVNLKNKASSYPRPLFGNLIFLLCIFPCWISISLRSSLCNVEEARLMPMWALFCWSWRMKLLTVKLLFLRKSVTWILLLCMSLYWINTPLRKEEWFSVLSSRNVEDVKSMSMWVLCWSWWLKLFVLRRCFCARGRNSEFPPMHVLYACRSTHLYKKCVIHLNLVQCGGSEVNGNASLLVKLRNEACCLTPLFLWKRVLFWISSYACFYAV